MSEEIKWPGKKYAWFFTTLLLITYTVSFIDRAMINLLIDPIRSDLKLSDIQMGQILGPGYSLNKSCALDSFESANRLPI